MMNLLLVGGWIAIALSIGWRVIPGPGGPTNTGLDVLEPTKGRRR